MIYIQKETGITSYRKKEIVGFIEEQLKMIPGIISFQKSKVISILRNAFNLTSGKVHVYQINKNEIYVELSLVLSLDVEYTQIENEILNILKYSIYKRYGLGITNIEIHIIDLI